MTATLFGKAETEKVVEQWILDAVRSEQSQRRSQVRYPFARPATICRGGFEVQAMCRDISKYGIGLIQSDCPPKRGKHSISIWLGKRVMQAPVNIFWTSKIGQNWWACGGHLVISMLDLFQLHTDRRISNFNNRRAHERYAFCHPFTAELADRKAGEFEHAEDTSIISLEVSTGGMRLISNEPFGDEGNVVYLRNESCPEKGALRCRIVSCLEMENGYYSTGVRFLLDEGLA